MLMSGALWLAVAVGIMTVAILWIVRTKSNAHSLDVGFGQHAVDHRTSGRADTSISR
jgi:hypothetical protein